MLTDRVRWGSLEKAAPILSKPYLPKFFPRVQGFLPDLRQEVLYGLSEMFPLPFILHFSVWFRNEV